MFKENPTGNPTSKRAVVWARVSTNDQAETSLPSQISRCKEKLESSGYIITHTFAVDWSSLDLYSCPEFQQLLKLIKNKETDALGVFDRDRLEAKGLQRLTFLSLCKEAGVQLVLCQGPPMLDEPEGQLVELALAIGKERQVLRARQGSRDGLHDRAVKRGLPVTYRVLYGYDWDKQNNRLLPNAQYPNVKLIFDLVLNRGWGYQPVIDELKKRGVLSPAGMTEWSKQTLSGILHSPTYAGRFYALKVRACEPTHRPKKSSRVNSSQKRLPLSEAHYMPEIEVVDPPIAWEQRERILQQLAEHQKLSQRNARNDYLLRGMILCGTHYGKQGEPRRYHGQPHHDSWRYTCPVGGCTRPFIRAPQIEQLIKFYVKLLFMDQPNVLFDDTHRRKAAEQAARELRDVEAKIQKKTQRLAQAYEDSGSGKLDPEAYDLVKARLVVQRNGLKVRERELQEQMNQLGREREARESLEELSMKYQLKLLADGDKLTNEEWRNLFIALNLRLKVEDSAILNGPFSDMRDMVVEVGVPLRGIKFPTPKSGTGVDIASGNPAPD